MSKRMAERGVRVRIGAVGVPLPPLPSAPPARSRRVGVPPMQAIRGLGASPKHTVARARQCLLCSTGETPVPRTRGLGEMPKRHGGVSPATVGADPRICPTQATARVSSLRRGGVLPTSVRSTLPTRGSVRIAVPVQEPTGKFHLSPPPSKPVCKRSRRQPARGRKLLAWTWRNAEPLGWMAVLTALVVSVWFSPRTALTRLQVQGVPPEAHAEVARLIRTHWRSPLVLSDSPRTLERALSAQDWVASVQWQAAGVGQARLIVRPRIPFAALQSPNGTRVFMDPAGVVFLPPNPHLKPIAGEIRPTRDYPLPSRGTVVHGEMRKAFTILQALYQRHEVHFPRVQLSRTHGVRLWLDVVRGAERIPLQVRFGDASALEIQLQTLERVLELPATELRRWAYVDISTPSAEVVKPRTASQ
ncbi:MAG: hypothetical protein RMK45_03285 [Armatimonadota bacterium]|nr:hypothetical protein [Armatimonadota bacterium]